MEYAVLGWPESGPTVRLDHEAFAYAGKFVVSGTGKAVAREDGRVVGAAAFDPDRTDETTLVIRYVTVRRDRQGEGIGPRLLRLVADRATDRGFSTVRIAVNNPHAYEASYRAGFGFTGDRTGIAEVVLVDRSRADRDPKAYRRGYEAFADRDLPDDVSEFVDRHREGDPPAVVPRPD